MPPAEAVSALERLLQDARVPAPERGRAALHLAALRLRAGDRGGAEAALDVAALDPAARAWAERTARLEATRRGVYRAAVDAPVALQSRSDDDPPEVEPPPPEPKRVAKVVAKPARAAKAPARKTQAHAAASAKKASAAKKPASKATTRTRAAAGR